MNKYGTLCLKIEMEKRTCKNMCVVDHKRTTNLG